MAILLGVLRNLCRNRIALLLKNNVVELPNRHLVGANTKGSASAKGVGKRIPSSRQLLDNASAGLDLNVQQPHGCVRQLLHAIHTMTPPADDLDVYLPFVDVNLRYFGRAEIAVARLALLELLGQIDPELHTNGSGPVLAWHLGVHYSFAGRHELQVACLDCAGVSCEILMVYGALEKVGYGFLTSVHLS